MSGPQTEVLGPLRTAIGEFDGVIYIPGTNFISANATLVPTRKAAGNYVMQRTAAAATHQMWIPLTENMFSKWGADPMASGFNNGIVPSNTPQNPTPAPGSGLYSPGTYPFGIGHAWRGMQLSEVDVAYNIGTASLTSLTPNFYRRQQRDNNTPVVTTNPGGALTINGSVATVLPNTFRANDYLSTIVFATPYILGVNDAGTEDFLELVAVDPGTSVLQLIGVYLKVNYNLH